MNAQSKAYQLHIEILQRLEELRKLTEHDKTSPLSGYPPKTDPAVLEEVRKAWQSGKPIQMRHVTWDPSDFRDFTAKESRGVGSVSICPEFDSPNVEWRVKPHKKRIPLGPEDVPPGSVLRFKSHGNHGWGMITGVGDSGVSGSKEINYRWSQLMHDSSLILRPGSKTWEPCSKEVEE